MKMNNNFFLQIVNIIFHYIKIIFCVTFSTLMKALVKWKKTSELWSVISDWFHQATDLTKKTTGLRFAVPDEETGISLGNVCKYLKVLSTYPQATSLRINFKFSIRKFFRKLLEKFY